jgi:hypothetical protein
VIEVVERVVGFPVRVGGEQHSGWLPARARAATPLPTPIRDVLLDIEIQYDGSGFLMCYTSQDGTVSGDTWHQSLQEAKNAASESFGVRSSDWLPGE